MKRWSLICLSVTDVIVGAVREDMCAMPQVIIKVSQLLGESVVLDSSHFYESLALINSYANSDKAMTRTSE